MELPWRAGKSLGIRYLGNGTCTCDFYVCNIFVCRIYTYSTQNKQTLTGTNLGGNFLQNMAGTHTSEKLYIRITALESYGRDLVRDASLMMAIRFIWVCVLSCVFYNIYLLYSIHFSNSWKVFLQNSVPIISKVTWHIFLSAQAWLFYLLWSRRQLSYPRLP